MAAKWNALQRKRASITNRVDAEADSSRRIVVPMPNREAGLKFWRDRRAWFIKGRGL